MLYLGGNYFTTFPDANISNESKWRFLGTNSKLVSSSLVYYFWIKFGWHVNHCLSVLCRNRQILSIYVFLIITVSFRSWVFTRCIDERAQFLLSFFGTVALQKQVVALKWGDVHDLFVKHLIPDYFQHIPQTPSSYVMSTVTCSSCLYLVYGLQCKRNTHSWRAHRWQHPCVGTLLERTLRSCVGWWWAWYCPATHTQSYIAWACLHHSFIGTCSYNAAALI